MNQASLDSRYLPVTHNSLLGSIRRGHHVSDPSVTLFCSSGIGLERQEGLGIIPRFLFLLF